MTGLIRQHIPRAWVLGLLLAVAIPANAEAKRTCEAPPGRSGIDQYCETVPSAGGDESGGNFDGTRRGRGGAALPGGTRSQLGRAGAIGAGVLNLVDQSGSGKAQHKRQRSSKTSDSGTAAPESVSSNPLSAVRSGVESGSSAGPGFVWALIAIVVLFVALGWVRYRRRGPAG